MCAAGAAQGCCHAYNTSSMHFVPSVDYCRGKNVVHECQVSWSMGYVSCTSYMYANMNFKIKITYYPTLPCEYHIRTTPNIYLEEGQA